MQAGKAGMPGVACAGVLGGQERRGSRSREGKLVVLPHGMGTIDSGCMYRRMYRMSRMSRMYRLCRYSRSASQ